MQPIFHLIILYYNNQNYSTFPRSMVRYSSWRRSLEIICMAQNFTYGIFDPWSYTEALWIINWVLINVSVHSPHICDIQVPEFLLNCCQAAIRACTVILVRSCNRISGLWLHYTTLSQVFGHGWLCHPTSPRGQFSENFNLSTGFVIQEVKEQTLMHFYDSI